MGVVMATESKASPVGVIANPMSGRDVRRLAARATSVTPESKRDQIARAVVGAAASGAERIMVVKEPMRISESAVENLGIDAQIEVIDVGATLKASDTHRAALAMRDAGCGAIIVLGGDGTNRTLCQVWQDAPLVPLSTGTNNVFPLMVEATLAGAAAGMVASGGVSLEEVSKPAKVIHLERAGHPDTLALIDMVLLEGDRVGNYLPVEPAYIRWVLLTRAEPASVGMSPIGGLLHPCGTDDDFGVLVRCVSHEDGGRPLRVPVSPGLFRTVHVKDVRRVELGEWIEIPGPGVLAFDGDREITLAKGEVIRAKVVREGPRVIDPGRAMLLAAERSLLTGKGHWRDSHNDAKFDCC